MWSQVSKHVPEPKDIVIGIVGKYTDLLMPINH